MRLPQLIYKLLPKRIKKVLSDTIYNDIIHILQSERDIKFKQYSKLEQKILLNYCLLIVWVQIYLELPYLTKKD